MGTEVEVGTVTAATATMVAIEATAAVTEAMAATETTVAIAMAMDTETTAADTDAMVATETTAATKIQGSQAGIGVWYGNGDSRNVSQPLAGSNHTNQRAELSAMNEAIRGSNPNQPLTIHSDSSYGIQAMTNWGSKWEQNGYRTSSGGEVKNQDLIREGRDLMSSRNAPVSFQHVSGHSGNYGNDQADSLANQGKRM
ncbi:hypothetical protein GGH15_004312 [Coemansia sp. RSA 562]|nr:hypothetical protein GGH15_004312 [Coemansia sp. RSA 562]